MEKENKSYINLGDSSLKTISLKRKVKDIIAYSIIGLATFFTVSVLVIIIAFIFINGAEKVSWRFLISANESLTNYIEVPVIDSGKENQLGIKLGAREVEGKTYVFIQDIERDSKLNLAVNKVGESIKVKKGNLIKKIGSINIPEIKVDKTAITDDLEQSASEEEIMVAIEEAMEIAIEDTLKVANEAINNETGKTITLKITEPGEGIWPMVMNTLLMIVVSLAIACPIGIFSAIYLVEYAKPGRLVRIIRLATESLSGIPSIIYGLFGMIFFVITLKLNYSILAGALTLSIILLPVIIRQTEESLKAVPMSYREGAFGLGATKLQTISTVVMPSAIPGILVAVILSIGRIVGESAALLLTATTVPRLATLFTPGATLTLHAYYVAKEEADITTACATGTIIVIIILILNALSKLISRKYTIKKG